MCGREYIVGHGFAVFNKIVTGNENTKRFMAK